MNNIRFLHNVPVTHTNPLSGKQVQTEGTLVAMKIGDTVKFGSSICSLRESYNKKEGRKHALSRAACGMVQPDFKGSKELKDFITHSVVSFGGTKTAANEVAKNLRKLWAAMETVNCKVK